MHDSILEIPQAGFSDSPFKSVNPEYAAIAKDFPGNLTKPAARLYRLEKMAARSFVIDKSFLPYVACGIYNMATFKDSCISAMEANRLD